MTTFQLVGLPLLAILTLLTVVAVWRHTINFRVGIAWVILWVLAAWAIAQPSLTMVVAHALGIGRGADLVLYCSILAMMAGFFLGYIRLKRMEREITRLVRHIAIKDAPNEANGEPASTQKV